MRCFSHKRSETEGCEHFMQSPALAGRNCRLRPREIFRDVNSSVIRFRLKVRFAFFIGFFHALNSPSPARRARPKVSSVFKISVTSAGLARANCLARSAGAIGAAAACKAVSTACIRSGKVLGQAIFTFRFPLSAFRFFVLRSGKSISFCFPLSAFRFPLWFSEHPHRQRQHFIRAVADDDVLRRAAV